FIPEAAAKLRLRFPAGPYLQGEARQAFPGNIRLRAEVDGQKMHRLSILLLAAGLLATGLACCASGAAAAAPPAADSYLAAAASRHEPVRFKKGFHFFRLRRRPSAEEVCSIDPDSAAAVMAAVRAAKAGQLCERDRAFLRLMVNELLQ
uniref:Phycoerythr_ab domain-containing protein n=2 Tax=Macrostomum lignano TaxID=282301 RepID=A0A1I8FPF9_9PLAT